MEQRRLRLGDTLDDYCTRERRLTNHVVVAMIDEDIKQTRCTTCDAEHAYKGGRVPKRKKKDTPAALYKDVLAGMPETDAAPVLTLPVAIAATVPPVAEVAPHVPVGAGAADLVGPTLRSGVQETTASALAAESPAPAKIIQPAASHVKPAAAQVKNVTLAASPAKKIEESKVQEAKVEEVPSQVEDVEPAEEGPVHRPLIRATLPRPEGQKDERRIPEFTIRQAAGRGSNSPFRGSESRMNPRGSNAGGQGGNGNRPHGGPRFAGSRPPQPGRGPAGRGGPVAGFRGGGQPRPGGGRKRSR